MGTDASFGPFEAALREQGQPELAIAVFRRHFDELVAGASGLMPEASLRSVDWLPAAEALATFAARGEAELARLVVIKLNGGLATSMGMGKAKSLLAAVDGHAFIDLIAEQIVFLRRRHQIALPLVLLDSFRTQADALLALARHADLTQRLPLSLLQHQVLKVLVDDLAPALDLARALGDPQLAWCPPGHGDLYLALLTSGLLQQLLAAGVRWAFVSNADNLGATPDEAALGILGWMADGGRPFVMECAERTAADRKGGHLARDLSDRLVLREVAQCPPEDSASFQDTARHRYFNTNNVWVDLAALARLLAERGGHLGLPLIRNKKPLDPTDPASPPVYQLETAMGAAISLFDGAAAVLVPRSRFLPVKTTSDLLLLWSDRYERTPGGYVRAAPGCSVLPSIDLDPRYFQNIEDFTARVRSPPSLRQATRLVVRGDVRFERGAVVRGEVTLEHRGEGQLVIDGPVGGAVVSGRTL